MNSFTAIFAREKETKNTVRFQEEPSDSSPPRIGSLYVQKWAAGSVQKLKVTVEEVH